MTAHDSTDSQWIQRLYEEACRVGNLQAGGFAAPAGRTMLADSTTVMVIDTRRGRPGWVVICSPPAAPHMAAQSADRAQAIRLLLSQSTARFILEPLVRGKLDHLDFIIYPHCRPVDLRRYHLLGRWRLRYQMFPWLRELAAETVSEPTDRELEENYRIPLKHLMKVRTMSRDAEPVAAAALEELDRRSWHPRLIAMHGDLWMGNILRRSSRSDGLAVIDWAGAMPRGFGIYDLVRLGDSLRVFPGMLRREAHAHSAILGCTPNQTQYHLAAALGYLGLHPGEFPEDRYGELVRRTMGLLRLCLSEDVPSLLRQFLNLKTPIMRLRRRPERWSRHNCRRGVDRWPN